MMLTLPQLSSNQVFVCVGVSLQSANGAHTEQGDIDTSKTQERHKQAHKQAHTVHKQSNQSPNRAQMKRKKTPTECKSKDTNRHTHVHNQTPTVQAPTQAVNRITQEGDHGANKRNQNGNKSDLKGDKQYFNVQAHK